MCVCVCTVNCIVVFVIPVPDTGHTLTVRNYMLGSMKLMFRFTLHVEL